MKRVEIYDTTLRDGAQAEEVNFSVEDKVRIALKLDEFKIDYIEGGWPGSNPKDFQFFKEIANYQLKHSKVIAFGSTHHPKKDPERDEIFQSLLHARADGVTIFGKTWTIHVKSALTPPLSTTLRSFPNSVPVSQG
jgi:2-isopropylmalate synthase (EC 2.3.3.13)